LICIPITADTRTAALRDLDDSLSYADVVELRMDLIRDGDLQTLMERCRQGAGQVKILVTNRRRCQESDSVEERRIEVLKTAVVLGANFVDIELDTPEVLRKELFALIKDHGCRTRLIVSHHDVAGTPSARKLKAIFHDCVLADADVVKIVTTASCAEDNLRVLELIPYARNKNRDVIAFCMGAEGKISRIGSLLLGSFLNFVALAKGAESAPGQMTVEEMNAVMDIVDKEKTVFVRRDAGISKHPPSFKYDSGTASSRIFAVFGNPVKQSLSPMMHNAALKRMKIEGVYVPICVKDLASAVDGVRGMDIRGVSITIPFKVSVMEHLDDLDADAVKIGAVNTLVNDNGRLKGYNTDWLGLVQSIEEVFGIEDKVFAVLGAGGTARAAIFGILKRGGVPILINRDKERGERLAHEWGCPFYPLSEAGSVSADCLVNTTPVGMMSDTESPVDPSILGHFRYVVDVIYRPLTTRLLRDAGKADCTTVSGLGMFVHQGAEQIKLWTGQEPPRAYMKQIIMEALTPGSFQE
jgi:shikimate dehydrogenase/3-dehydroquinate dehydratase type I